MNNKDDIKKLICKRDNLKAKLAEWKNKGKNAIHIYEEYEQLTEQLKSLGRNVSSKSDYLTREFWENFDSSKIVSQPLQPNMNRTVEDKIKNLEYRLLTLENTILPKKEKKIERQEESKQENTYVLSLAWDEPVCSNKADLEELDQRLSDIRGYLEFLGLVKISTDANHLFDKTEYVTKYEFSGDDRSFNIVKLSSSYLIDMFSKHENMNNINISIFGKKRTF